jgi:hypothetical protein
MTAYAETGLSRPPRAVRRRPIELAYMGIASPSSLARENQDIHNGATNGLPTPKIKYSSSLSTVKIIFSRNAPFAPRGELYTICRTYLGPNAT